jgi:hypothetical protein
MGKKNGNGTNKEKHLRVIRGKLERENLCLGWEARLNFVISVFPLVLILNVSYVNMYTA